LPARWTLSEILPAMVCWPMCSRRTEFLIDHKDTFVFQVMLWGQGCYYYRESMGTNQAEKAPK
jgi:hypothetical protein